MRTTQYNPSQLEVELAYAFSTITEQIEEHLSSAKIVGVDNKIQDDNPSVTFHLEDTDGDPHEVVIKLIQKPDKF